MSAWSRWTRSRRVRIALGVLVLAAVALELDFALRGYRMCHPPRSHVTAADVALARSRLPTIEDVAFRTSDGLTLRGFYVPSKNGAVVVMGHGLMANRMYYLPDVEMLARHGYGALFFDWRDHGESDGDVSTWSDREQEDLRAAVGYAASRPDVVDGRIATMGFSVGASTAAMEATTDSRVHAVILEAVFSSFSDEMDVKVGRLGFVTRWPAMAVLRAYGLDPDHIRPLDHIGEISPRPVLFVTGTRDDDTPVPVVEAVYARASWPKRLFIVDGANHGKYENVDPGGCERVFVEFLDEALRPVEPRPVPPESARSP